MSLKPKALKKDMLFPGVVLQVRSDVPLTDGLGGLSSVVLGPGSFSPVIKSITAQSPSSFLPNEPTTPEFVLKAGELCTVVHGPKKIGNVNVARVQNAGGLEGLVFWCELKANCFLYEPAVVARPKGP